MLIPALVTSLAAVILTLAGVELREIPPETDLHRAAQSVINAAIILLIAMNVAQSLVVTLVASGLAMESVQREHRHQTWDFLYRPWQNPCGVLDVSPRHRPCDDFTFGAGRVGL
jgi:hypothetical protein